MSLQVNLSSRELLTAYQDVVNANGIDWALFTYDKGSNDLKVQSTGDGGLEELEEEFSDGRIQYAFVRVTEPTSQLPKFVQINWCGDGVPVQKKGLFHTHSSAVANFLKGTHVVISARNQADVSPLVIMSRVETASGAKYSIHKEPARKIGPVGTNYTPVGKVDINAIRKEATVKSPPPPQSTTNRPPGVGKQWSKPVTTGFQPRYTAPPPVKPTPAPDDDWEPAPTPAKPTPAPPLPTATRPTPPAPAPVKEEPKPAVTPSKSVEEDRIGPVGTNWEPVQLPKPKRLVNPFERRAQEALQEQQQPAKPPVKRTGMTWSERQALAKKQAAEEEARSKASSFTPSPATVSAPKWKAPAAVGLGVGAGIATSVGAATLASRDEEEPEEADWEAPAPPPPPPTATRPPPQPHPEPEPEPGPEAAPPPPPPPPPPPAPVPEMATLTVREPEPEFVPPPPPPPPPPAPAPVDAPRKGKGLCAIVQYEYEAAEENEMNLVEGELIEEIEELGEGWCSGVGGNGAKSGLFPTNYVELIEQADEPEPEPEPQAAPPPPPPPPPPPVAREPSPEPQDQGTVAIALYDYDAAEENEISFREGDRITEIEAVSEDWWQGKATDGSVGLFPVPYVELIEQAGGPGLGPEPQAAPPPPPPPPPPPVAREPIPEPQDQGTVAIALYDYDAAEENEISFRGGERIIEIEAASDDWWQGKTADGSVGLFPANYVEVQQ